MDMRFQTSSTYNVIISRRRTTGLPNRDLSWSTCTPVASYSETRSQAILTVAYSLPTLKAT
jgi:hypothetical protein